jgi:hypothetical protein
LGSLKPPPQLMEFKHSNGKGGPDLKDRRKAMIEQIHCFKTHAQTQKRASKQEGAILQCGRIL